MKIQVIEKQDYKDISENFCEYFKSMKAKYFHKDIFNILIDSNRKVYVVESTEIWFHKNLVRFVVSEE